MHRLIGHSQRDSLDSTVQLSILIHPVVAAAVNLRRSTILVKIDEKSTSCSISGA